MKKHFIKSIYAKFTMIFLGIWWLLNVLTFAAIANTLSTSNLAKWALEHQTVFTELHKVRYFTAISFLISSIIGTLIILVVVRGIVKPIKRLSDASKEVSRGNFEIQVEPRSSDEIGQLTVDFNLMTKELKNIDVLRRDFVSNVSHEFKTPITAIKGFARLIREGSLSDEQILEYSDIIINESERLSLLSSNLLKISELDSKVIYEQAAVFSLDEQIRKAILILEAQWSKKEIEFDIQLEALRYSGNENLLAQVWLNLISNAVKFSDDGGVVRITLHKDAGIIAASVANGGAGIAEEDKPHIFERFYKGDKSRSKEGNGLGLVIVEKIVKLFNGTIYFTSEAGGQTVFTVQLPA